MKKVGIMGGTFDPIHNGHCIAALMAKEQAGLDEIWFIPSNDPPLKPKAPKANALHRLRMVELATRHLPFFHVLDIELKRSGTSYTYDTVSELLRLYPDVELYFIVGTDRINDLTSWYKADELKNLIQFIGISRGGETIDLSSMSSEWKSRLHIVETPLIEMSSTLIRNRLANQLSISYYCHELVAEYIKEHHLYE